MKWWFRRREGPIIGANEPVTAGHLDTLEAGLASGWAFQARQPEQRVRVRVLVDGHVVAEGIADRQRRDLEVMGYGDGQHGFAIALPAACLDGREHVIEAIDAETGTRLHTHSRYRRLTLGQDLALAAIDRLFDPSFYEAQVGRVAHPLDHYREIGWRHGFDPHRLFSTRHYLAQYGPLDTDPLTHFAETGQWASAWTHPLLDPKAEGPPAKPIRSRDWWDGDRDLAQAESRSLHPLLAYLSSVDTSNRPLSRYFSEDAYRTRNPDVDNSQILPLLHYIEYGWRENRRPHPEFEPRLFSKLAGLDRTTEPYTHFLTWLQDDRYPRKGGAATTATRSVSGAAPAVSVIVLNYDKSLLTLQALYMLDAYTEPGQIETIVVDNGSRPEAFATLARHAHGATLVRLDVNRGFGEANNIGVEHAHGQLLVFLNNDAFVRPGWLAPLRAAIEADPRVGAVGAKLLYPDGRLQEAGAMISACGTAVQRGKHLDPSVSAFNNPGPVDYCSAAALMVRADAFRTVLGFDLCWDPAYYEDADLCLKLRTIGLATVYAPGAEVVHIEHATSSDSSLDLRLHDIVAINRRKFVGRWGDWLAGLPGTCPPALARGRRDDTAETIAAHDAIEVPGVPSVLLALPTLSPTTITLPNAESVGRTRTLGLYTPYALTPGGGERYLLTIAEALRDSHHVTLLTPDRYSRLRLLTVARELGLNLDHVAVEPLSNPDRGERFDLFVCMANEVLPPMRGLGRANLYHCQFPFPMHPTHYGRGWHSLASYDAVAVNSAFTARHFAAAAAVVGMTPPPVHVLAPPVPQVSLTPTRGAGGVARILSVGRFAPGGHAKRQDLMIPAFERLLNRVAGPVELHLAGAVGSESAARVYLQELIEAARDLPVRFHPNASSGQIAALYAGADLYWHLTGAELEVERDPEQFEHFGIALAEAMSAGAVPVALGYGGPAEIITDGCDGTLIYNVRDLPPRTAQLLSDPALRSQLSRAAQARAATFAPQAFADGLKALIAEVDATRLDRNDQVSAHALGRP